MCYIKWLEGILTGRKQSRVLVKVHLDVHAMLITLTGIYEAKSSTTYKFKYT